MPLELSAIDTWSGLETMLLTGWYTGPLTGISRVRLAGGMMGICAEMLTEVCVTLVAVVTRGIIVNFVDLRVETVFESDVSVVVRIDVIFELGSDTLAITLIAVVTDIGVLIDAYANMWVTLTPVLDSIA